MSYTADTDALGLSEDDKIIMEAKKRFKACEDWEATARVNFEYDYKFANADSVNMFQWDNWVVGDRMQNQRPCLTINKTMQHCLQIINDGKQNKPGVNINPVGDTASFEAAQIFQEVVRHIEYISSAESVYDSASEFQVIGGWGYWTVTTDYLDDTSFDQEIFIKRIKDPRSVYLDPDINEADGSDASFGFIFDDKPRDLYEAEHPDHKDVGGNAIFNDSNDGWYTKDHVRVCKYYRKTRKEDKYVYFVLPETGEEIESFYSELPPEGKAMFKEIVKREDNLPTYERTYRERKVVRGDIQVFKIAGNTIIDRSEWLGKYIPIVRVIGRETIIDGQLDRIGHTRALLDPQRIYNVNSSANVEFGALQTKSPIMAASAAIEGYEEYYRTSNTTNHAYMPFNHIDDDGNPIPPPSRMAAPQASPAYVQQMQIAQNEMMMVTGQYQAQMGENENAKSGIAINARQRQGDRATYHFIDGLGVAIRYTGKILIDLIPKIYDTKRIMKIEAKDGTIIDLTIDPNAPQAYQKLLPDDPTQDNEQMIKVIFNPNVGKYAVQSDTGPSFATRRQEAFNALTQIAAQNKEFMGIAGDILWRVADFPEAQILSQRWRKIIPPNISGDAPNPQLTEAMDQAAKKIEEQLATIAKMQQELDDKDRELKVKEGDMAIKAANTMLDNIRADYRAIDDRIKSLGNSGPAISVEQIQPLIQQAVMQALRQGSPSGDIDVEQMSKPPGIGEGGTPIEPPEESGEASNEAEQGEAPSQGQAVPDPSQVPGAQMGPDGNHYVKSPDGKWLMVQPNA